MKQIIIDQKEELYGEFSNKKLVERGLRANIKTVYESNLIKIVTGVRRSGKSVFLFQLLKDKDFAYLNFDDDRLVNINPSDILNNFYEIYGKNIKIIFFDEIQNLNNWELFVNRLKRAGFNIFITGSNAKLLSRELATHLTGRHIALELFPFSFKEYLKARHVKINLDTSRGKSLIKHELGKFILEGAFPEVVVDKENYKIYLRELFRTTIDRDIIIRRKISYEKTFKEMSSFLISNSGSLISYNKLKKQFNLKSDHTVKNYISYLTEAYIFFLVNRFSYKVIDVEKSEKKIYAIDTGLINSISTKFSSNFGRLYENAVAIELKRKQPFNSNLEIYYYKNPQGHEVDFVVKEGLKVKQLIQVCYDIEDYDTKKREIKGLLHASRNLKCKNLLVITEDYENEEKVEWFGMKGNIKFVPLWKFLLV